MRVPQSPHRLEKLMATGKSDDEDSIHSQDCTLSKPPFHTSKSSPDFSIFNESNKEKNLKNLPEFIIDGGNTPTSSTQGIHRSRERTRKSAVLKLLERKQAQEEKEREKERDRSLRTRSGSSSRISSATFFQSETVFVGNESRKRGASVTYRGNESKTYITIEAGKPTRIRESSPSKSHRIGNRYSTSESSGDSSRDSSPSKKCDLLDSPPLKTAQLLKNISDSNSSNEPELDNHKFTKFNNDFGLDNRTRNENHKNLKDTGRKKSFTTEKTIFINGTDSESPFRRMHVSASTSNLETHFSSFHEKKSNEKDLNSNRSNHSFSSSSSSLNSDSDDLLSKRRISLEERFKARSSKISSSDRVNVQETTTNKKKTTNTDEYPSASSRLLHNLNNSYHRVAAANQERNRRYSHDHSNNNNNNKNWSKSKMYQRGPIRKISMPPTCFEEPERTRWDFKSNFGDGNYSCTNNNFGGGNLNKFSSSLNLSSSFSSRNDYHSNRKFKSTEYLLSENRSRENSLTLPPPVPPRDFKAYPKRFWAYKNKSYLNKVIKQPVYYSAKCQIDSHETLSKKIQPEAEIEYCFKQRVYVKSVDDSRIDSKVVVPHRTKFSMSQESLEFNKIPDSYYKRDDCSVNSEKLDFYSTSKLKKIDFKETTKYIGGLNNNDDIDSEDSELQNLDWDDCDNNDSIPMTDINYEELNKLQQDFSSDQNLQLMPNDLSYLCQTQINNDISTFKANGNSMSGVKKYFSSLSLKDNQYSKAYHEANTNSHFTYKSSSLSETSNDSGKLSAIPSNPINRYKTVYENIQFFECDYFNKAKLNHSKTHKKSFSNYNSATLPPKFHYSN